ncbi:MAG TPA: pyruvate, phosphate dikinase [Syntrophorhabdus sp.]|nr:pyruvate, phosphate dikinase [Syntrophorhabdus sp.]MBP8744486.1 pyruvate, phosphate dikinase [Syntrophorhabdus sp.]HOD76844.1 pyruvate, phosphate dikinase [Syntrophorhabdus sp.]HQG24632.1 pyruvate, phosphate dikinase [Syntrophorhabdus sp.]HQH81311.1 pyruvate, phosphate dikinase [Syntrophorhabdus sp.]
MKKYVYFFGGKKAEGGEKLRNLLGGKGAGLAEMINLGIPVPPGFTITTEACVYFYQHKMAFPDGLKEEVQKNLKKVEKEMGAIFGDPKNPLLFSVRSGARVSMPGMMDTVLNLGLNEKTVKGLGERTNNEWFAYDCYRRFVQMYGDVVLGLKPQTKEEHDPFEDLIEKKKKDRKITLDTEMSVADLKDLVSSFKGLIKTRLGIVFPEDPLEQLWGAIGAVFKSWNTERAIAYRELNNIPDTWGTAVNVQCMVFGNMGANCGTGVAFTRNPATGENQFYGEYLLNAQGEDVVAGIRTPLPINKKQKTDKSVKSLEEVMPGIYKELLKIIQILEGHFKDMQDIEFTIQDGKLWMLQTRTGKRTAFSAFKIAVDMVKEKLIDKEEALMRVEPEQLNQLLRPIFDPKEKEKTLKAGNLMTKGLNAGPGAATGKVVYNAEDAESWAAKGEKVILVRIETSPEDIRGMNAAQGILTSRGGMTSHAALVARQMGKVCVAGCGDLDIDYKKKTISVNGKTIREGEYISIDGTTGEVFSGEIKTIPSEILRVLVDKTLRPSQSQVYQDFALLMKWADETRKLGIRTNADQPDQAAIAIAFGAEGIGLCRTEHMFFESERIDVVREMIISDDREGRVKALKKLLPIQKKDFVAIFKVMKDLPTTIRTLDPPLHEFLPHTEKEIKDLAQKMGISAEKVSTKVESLHEANPMLGHRGCRLGIVFPEITEMQAQAIFEAACDVKKKGFNVKPEIMIPLVGNVAELVLQKEVVDRVAQEVMKKTKVKIDYKVGTMIEIPRAAITADEIGTVAEFFSFGTNDLTQTALGMSRDDAGKFLGYYVENGIYAFDPFQRIDEDGVGKLMKIGVDLGRKARKNLKIGICGEHGGEPNSVEFCHKTGLNYVSCSPYRVTVAKLAAARAAIKEKKGERALD